MITRRLAVAPAPKGTRAPLWDKFIEDTSQGDDELVRFKHRWFGYCLSGDVSAEMFVFCYGTGGNGKGTTLNVVSEIAHDYFRQAASQTFMERKHEAHPQEIAKLHGARMVFATEPAKHSQFDLSRLKELTGNEGKITGRYMRQNDFEFKPTHKLTFVGNFKPALGHVDEAIRRRLVLLEFLHQVNPRDPTLKEKLRTEYPAILRYLVEGGVEVYAHLKAGQPFVDLVPASAQQASLEYLIGEDVVAQWLTERCVAEDKASVLIAEAFDDHQKWAQSAGCVPFQSNRKFSGEVVRLAQIAGMSITVGHSRKGNTLCGVRLM